MADLNATALNVTRTQNHAYRVTFSGLLPNTTYSITANDVDHGYATRTIGKGFGESLTSNANGELQCEILWEIPFNRDRNFELPQTATVAFQTGRLAQTDRREQNQTRTSVVFEVTTANGLSKAQYILPMNIILTAGPVQVLFPIE
jgi:hypothetical protein